MSESRSDLVVIVGLLRSTSFHKAKHIAECLQEESSIVTQYEELLEVQWCEYRDCLNRGLQVAWNSDEGVAIFKSGQLFSSMGSFEEWATSSCTDLQDVIETDYISVAEQAYTAYFTASKCDYVFMDISVAGELSGRLVFELYSQQCPKTCANFVALCTGEKGVVGSQRLSYVNSLIHRIVPNGWIQGGDICSGSGSEGMSIFGKYFEDECFAIPHSHRGVLGMANSGPNTNNSQFYITLQETPWMNKLYVAFGRLIEGSEVLKQIEQLETYNERPCITCQVSNCGQFTTHERPSH